MSMKLSALPSKPRETLTNATERAARRGEAAERLLPLASVSLDLDNEWSYLKTHGDAGWESFPTYLPTLVPRVLDFLAERQLSITMFVVGQDAALEVNRPWLRALADAGHEIGNHSFRHEPWLHLYSQHDIETELARAEETIEVATGATPRGFRGPGFSVSSDVIRVLARRGYEYDCSTFPTFLGPLARTYYFMTTRLSVEQRRERKQLFGKFSEGLRPLKGYAWRVGDRQLVEIPVTTLPGARTPIHLSYVLYLAQFSRLAAMQYFRAAVNACRLARVEPSILLHPLDFLGCDDNTRLDFFPAMRMHSADKMRVVSDALALLARSYSLVPMREHAQAVRARPRRRIVPVEAM